MPLHEADTDWSRIDKVRYVGWGTFFTVAVDVVVYPMEVRPETFLARCRVLAADSCCAELSPPRRRHRRPPSSALPCRC